MARRRCQIWVRQAERTAKALAKEKSDAIYTSDLLARRTDAEPLAKLLKLEIHASSASANDTSACSKASLSTNQKTSSRKITTHSSTET